MTWFIHPWAIIYRFGHVYLWLFYNVRQSPFNANVNWQFCRKNAAWFGLVSNLIKSLCHIFCGTTPRNTSYVFVSMAFDSFSVGDATIITIFGGWYRTELLKCSYSIWVLSKVQCTMRGKSLVVHSQIPCFTRLLTIAVFGPKSFKKYVLKIFQKFCPKKTVLKICQKICPKKSVKNPSKICPNNLSKNHPKYLSKNLPKKLSNNLLKKSVKKSFKKWPGMRFALSKVQFTMQGKSLVHGTHKYRALHGCSRSRYLSLNKKSSHSTMWLVLSAWAEEMFYKYSVIVFFLTARATFRFWY